jgi:hypothetical protein
VRAPVTSAPVTIALVNDYDIVVMGLAHIVEQYQDRVVIAELDTNQAAPRPRLRVGVDPWSGSG